MKPPLKLLLRGEEWTFCSQIRSTYARKHDHDGKPSDGITYFSEKTIYFCHGKIRPSLVRHELLHAYISAGNITSANLSSDQMEEICCDIYADYGPEMDMQMNKIVHHFMD